MIVIPNYVVKEDDGLGGSPDNSSMKHINIFKTKRSKLQQKQSRRNSQPIPIPINQKLKELEREATSHDSYLQYDMATWRMHNRITSARRLRAYSLCYSSSPSSSSNGNDNDERYAAAARHKLMQYYCYQQLYLEVVVPRSSTGVCVCLALRTRLGLTNDAIPIASRVPNL